MSLPPGMSPCRAFVPSYGNYGGVEVQLIVSGMGPRAGLFMSDLRHKPMATIDFSLVY